VQVSFIIPLFNNLPLTRACVESLQATLPAGLAHEIILVDDGSTDGTREWLATLTPPFRVILNERNLGYAAANNRGAALAHGKFLALLNNDLILTPHWLEPMLGAHRLLLWRAGLVGNIQFDARTGAVDHVGILVDHRGKPEHDRMSPSSWSRFFAPVRRVPAVTAACVLLKRSLWVQLGGFDESYINGCEDVDLCFRARAAGRINAVALRSVVRHHVSASPGRKLHDEENSYRLARRWRRELVAAATEPLRDWCFAYLEGVLPEPRDADRVLARRAWLYARGLSRTPPPEALAAVDARLGREFAHWEKMFPAAAH
jgi:O-antigen biosynthesis protein